ncbi:MAG: M14 family zinc carboxypeptidase [Runella sp.]
MLLRTTYYLLTALCLQILAFPLLAQQIDEAYNQKIKEYTTDPRFLPSSVLDLAADPKIPSPLKQFGQIIGAPGRLHSVSEIYGYFKTLAQTSPNIINEQIGITEEGRPIQMSIIANAATLKRLDHYKKQLALLADPRKIAPADVAKIIGDSKVVYFLNGAMHATETGSAEMYMELAYRLVTGQSEDIKAIRDNIIVLINPVSEPDGWDKMVDWYNRYTKKRTDFDDGMPASPPYWGKYVFHDNNRDGLQVSQAITKSIFKTYFDWHPTVMLDLHESLPLLYISTGTGPYSEAVDPVAIGEWQVMADHDMTTLAAQGLPGVFNWAFYDGWYPGYGIWVANNHNSIGRFYETYGNAGANTFMRDLSTTKFAGDNVTSREWYRPYPATEKVYWSFRNNINYMQAGVLASLGYAATNGKLLLKNFYQKSLNSLKKGIEGTPKAFSIPKDQRDPAMAAYLVNQLRTQGIEVHRAESGKNQGDYVVLLNQPYGKFATSLLTKQNYPKEAKFPPYDAIAWTLQYLNGVTVNQQDTLKYDLADLKLLTADAKFEGKVEGEGNHYVLHYKAQNTVLPAAYWAKSQNGRTIVLDEKTTLQGRKDTLAQGAVVFTGISADQAKQLAAKFGFDLTATSTIPNVKQHEVTLPRVAIYHTWYNTQDEGWARYTFEQRGIPYTSIHKDHLKKGNLRAQFDVILVPRVGGTGANFLHEIDTKFGPMPYTKTTDYPSHGTPSSTDDMTGGPGFEGVAELKKFVDTGGVLITLDNSSSIMSDLGIVRELKRYDSPTLFHPGSIVQVKARNRNHPILYGYPEVFHVFKGQGPLLQTEKRDRAMMLMQYGTKPLKDEEEYKGLIMGMPDRKEIKPDPKATTPKPEPPYVLSGMVRNEQTIIGHGGIFNVPVGQGQVVAFTFDPLHRYLNHHDAPLVWNAILNWNALR